jgi:hypothetical protein
VIRCTKAIALRLEMRKHSWRQPDEKMFQAQGLDWLFTLISALDKEVKENKLLLLWRVWFMRNNIMHGDGRASVLGSVEFLRSYATLLV